MSRDPLADRGLCECGCGDPAPLAPTSNARRGWVRGEPVRFRAGHQTRVERAPEVDRFWAKVDKTGACWEWNGARTRAGYGRFTTAGGEAIAAHRWSYQAAHGEIPDGLFVLHSCDNPPCVNPAHLRAGTHRENMRDRTIRGRNAMRRKTHCKHGHEFTPENTRVGRDGSRSCRTCHRERATVRRAALSAATEARP